jgi:hemolysin III
MSPRAKFLDHDAALVVMADKMAELKPRLRGWLHAGSIPFVLSAGIVLIVLSPTAATEAGSAVFTGSALLLFGVSAIYHRGTWQPAVWALLRRLDHSNIFILIAGTYTGYAMSLLHGHARVYLLVGIWAGAVLGVAFRVFWTDAPRWLYTPIYIALGWFAVFFIPDFIHGARHLGTATEVAVAALTVAGGVLYTVGGVTYGLKRPNPKPEWFGFHEVFHTFTILAFAANYAAISLATYSLR